MKQYRCNAPGCTTIIDRPGYCDHHRTQKKTQQSEQTQKPFSKAVRSNEHLYNTARWRSLRRKILSTHGWCAICGTSCQLQVHHITPPRGNEQLFFAPENLIVVCEWCHRRLTHREITHRGSQKKYVQTNAAIDALRDAIAAAEKAEPMFLLHTGAMYGNERDEYEVQADSVERVDLFCDHHPRQTFPLYLHPPEPARQPMTTGEFLRLMWSLSSTTKHRAGATAFGFELVRAVEAFHGIRSSGEEPTR